MLPLSPVSVRKVPPCLQRVCCLTPTRNLGAPSDCSAQGRRSHAWQDLCVEVCRQHTIDLIQRCSRTTRDKVITVTRSHVPVFFRDEHHRDDHNGFASLFDQCVSDFISPTLARRSCSVPRFHTSPTDSWWCQSLWRNDHDSPAPLRMEERHSNVVSGNQTIVLSLRIGFSLKLDTQ